MFLFAYSSWAASLQTGAISKLLAIALLPLVQCEGVRAGGLSISAGIPLMTATAPARHMLGSCTPLAMGPRCHRTNRCHRSSAQFGLESLWSMECKTQTSLYNHSPLLKAKRALHCNAFLPEDLLEAICTGRQMITSVASSSIGKAGSAAEMVLQVLGCVLQLSQSYPWIPTPHLSTFTQLLMSINKIRCAFMPFVSCTRGTIYDVQKDLMCTHGY